MATRQERGSEWVVLKLLLASLDEGRKGGSKLLEKQSGELAPDWEESCSGPCSFQRELGHDLRIWSEFEADGQKFLLPYLSTRLLHTPLNTAEAGRSQCTRETVKTANTVEELGFTASGVRCNPGACLGILIKLITKRKGTAKANMKSAHCH